MKAKLLYVTAIAALLASGCTKSDLPAGIASGLDILEPYAFEIKDEIPLISFQEAQRFIHSHPEYVTTLGGCSCFKTTINNGETVLGRNMDLTLTSSPLYVYHIKGKYKATGVCYPSKNAPTYDEAVQKGISDEFRKIIPWLMPNDLMNETGFYIEDNMRPEELTEDGTRVHRTGHTDPSKPALYISQIPAYLASRCATVAEALDTIKNVDIYSEINGKDIWNIGFMMADATGDCGVLEVADGKIHFTRHDINVNHFVDPELLSEEHYGIGFGREDNIRSSMPMIENEGDVFGLMYRIRFSQMYESLVTGTFLEPVDWRGDIIGQLPVDDEGHINPEKGKRYNSSKEWCYRDDQEHLNELKTEGYKYIVQSHPYSDWADIRFGKDTGYWVTVYSIVANCTKRTLTMHFYEDRNVGFSYEVK